MFPLPKKLLFGSLDSETIDQRTRDIEEYMATIITNIPAVSLLNNTLVFLFIFAVQMLKSRYVDDFFGISDRIKTITAQLDEMSKKVPPVSTEEEQLFTGVVPLAPGVEEEMGRGDTKEATEAAARADTKAEVVRVLEMDDVSDYRVFLDFSTPKSISRFINHENQSQYYCISCMNYFAGFYGRIYFALH